jgi:WD40 repeat protein
MGRIGIGYNQPAMTSISMPITMTESGPELVIVGHSSYVTSLAFSADGRSLVSRGDDRAIVWDMETRTMRRVLTRSGDDSMDTAALSPDGRLLVTGYWPPMLWDLDTSQLVRRFYGRDYPFAFSPDGRILASVKFAQEEDGGWDIILSRVRTGRVIRRIPCGESQPESVAFSSDGQLVSALSVESPDDVLVFVTTLCEVNGGVPHRRLWDHPVVLFCMAVGPKTRLAALAPDGSRLWDAETGALIRTVHQYPSRSVHHGCQALSLDGTCVAVGDDDGTVQVWGRTEAQHWSMQGHDSWVRALAFSPDGAMLATAGEDRLIRLWETETGKDRGSLGSRRVVLSSVAFGAEGHSLTVGDDAGIVRRWDLDTATMASPVTLPPSSLPDDGQTSDASWLNYADTLRGLTVWLRQADRRRVTVSPDGGRAVMLGVERNPVLLDVATGHALATLSEDAPWRVASAFSPDGTKLAVNVGLNTLEVWDAVTGGLIRSWEVPKEHELGSSFAFTGDGQTLASGDSGYDVILWDVRTGQRKRRCSVSRDDVCALAFSPDGKMLAVGTAYDKMLWTFGLGRGGRKRVLRGHAGALRAVAYSPDGAWLASVAADSTVRLWEAASGRPGLTIRVLSPEDWVAYTPDGFYTGSDDVEKFLLWRVNSDLLPGAEFASEFRRPERLAL